MNKKDLKLELNKLVELLGGKDNILDTEVEMSRFKVTLKDVSKANKEGILKLFRLYFKNILYKLFY